MLTLPLGMTTSPAAVGVGVGLAVGGAVEVGVGLGVRDCVGLGVGVALGDADWRVRKEAASVATLVEPRALRLIVVTDPPTQRLELNDGLLITPKDPARLAAILARHHLQEPVTVAGITCRAVTQPRGDLLGLDQRLVALRADADVASVEADTSSIPTHK